MSSKSCLSRFLSVITTTKLTGSVCLSVSCCLNISVTPRPFFPLMYFFFFALVYFRTLKSVGRADNPN